MCREAPLFTERTSVGLGVHARSVAAAAIDGVTGELIRARLTPAHDHIGEWVRALPGPVAVAYEAGPTGFGLYRSLTAAGIRCEVVAPSKLHKPPVIGSRPMPETPCCWRDCCGSTRSPRSAFRPSTRRRLVTWCGRARNAKRI